MPSGKTHDIISLLLAAPVAAAAWSLTRNLETTLIITSAMLFGAMVFGPDLDVVSRQYSRWGVFRFLWCPYRLVFPHRSRWTHGLIAGAAFRVVYLAGAVTLCAFVAAYCVEVYLGRGAMRLSDFTNSWAILGAVSQNYIGFRQLGYVFLGLWLGAASHTLTDIAGSFIKTGRAGKFL
jgi:uncharacterized metal-binding protein